MHRGASSDDLGEVAKAAESEKVTGNVLDALQVNFFAQNDGLIFIMSPALGPDRISQLKDLVEDLGRNLVP